MHSEDTLDDVDDDDVTVGNSFEAYKTLEESLNWDQVLEDDWQLGTEEVEDDLETRPEQLRWWSVTIEVQGAFLKCPGLHLE